MKNLAELASAVEGATVVGNAQVTDVCYDSRQVKPGDLFVCVCGLQSDGHRFAKAAVEKGAAALVVEHPVEGVEVPYMLVPDSRLALARVGAAFFDYPAREMLNIGITGTNGKTTTAYLTEAVLRSMGRDPGLLGTIQARVGGQVRRLANTTPESLELQRLFREMRQAEQDSVVMEVSSHALALGRTHGIPYDIAVFTNLTQDHLDFHKTMEEYFQTKTRLFRDLGTYAKRPCGPFAIINLDDPYGKRLCELIQKRVPVITYGTDSQADVRAFNVDASPNGLSFLVETRLEVSKVELQMSGMFNLHNCLAAIAVGIALRGNMRDIVAGVETVASVPGRFQLVREGQPFTVVVDYAHTPDGLQRVLESARAITSNKLSVVFGCGGDRDKGKRPIMGRIAADLADKVFVTSDNPRSEEIADIIAQIMEGVGQSSASPQVEIEPDRALAIAKALAQAEEGDTVVIAGKGHEDYQKFRDRTVHFDDVEVARENLRKRQGAQMLASFVPKVRLPINWDYSMLRTPEEIKSILGIA